MIQEMLIAATLILQGGPQEAAKPKEARVREFVKAFFSEDEKAILPLSEGRLKRDMESYFWIRRSIQGKSQEPREWKGEVKILKSARRQVLSLEAVIGQEEADVFELMIDGKAYQCGVDDRNAVILFRDGAK